MGHKNSRRSYGDGGSMEYRRDKLLEIAHPISDEFQSRLPKFESLITFSPCFGGPLLQARFYLPGMRAICEGLFSRLFSVNFSSSRHASVKASSNPFEAFDTKMRSDIALQNSGVGLHKFTFKIFSTFCTAAVYCSPFAHSFSRGVCLEITPSSPE